MPASLRILRRRIRSTKNIAQITKAMEMVAASRIVKAQARVKSARPYSDEFTHVLTTAAKAGASDHPLLVAREEPTRSGVLVVTSDRGLAGGYNANILREAERLMRELSDAGKEPSLFVIGGKGTSYFRFRGREAAGQWTGFSEVPDYHNATRAADTLTACFLAGGQETVQRPSADEGSGSGDGSGEGEGGGSSQSSSFVPPEEAEGLDGVDELHVVFTAFDSVASQSVVSRQIAPLQLDEEEDEDSSGESSSGDSEERQAEYEFEPEPEVLFDRLMPKYLRARVFAALLDAAASESAARQRAMKAATDNANDLVDNLTREANQARQAQITQEISEIVGGANALAE
jgi:F-type H+-transporting ATPase subunit gamma